MASVVDTIRTIVGLRFSFVKIALVNLIFSYPLYMMVSQFEGWFSLWSCVTYCVGVFFLGYLMLSCHNLIIEDEYVLPSFLNPFKILLAGLGGVVALAPLTALMCFLGFWLNQILSLYSLDFEATVTIVAVIELLMFGFLMIQMTLYTNKLNPLSAFNFIKICRVAGDFVFKITNLLLVLLAFTLLIVYPLGYLAYQIFDIKTYPFFFFISFLLTFVIMIIFLYYAQIAMENILLARKDDFLNDSMTVLDRNLLIDNDKKF